MKRVCSTCKFELYFKIKSVHQVLAGTSSNHLITLEFDNPKKYNSISRKSRCDCGSPMRPWKCHKNNIKPSTLQAWPIYSGVWCPFSSLFMCHKLCVYLAICQVTLIGLRFTCCQQNHDFFLTIVIVMIIVFWFGSTYNRNSLSYWRVS